jgi:hypothetical protein
MGRGAVAWPRRLHAANTAVRALQAAIEEGFTAEQIAAVKTWLVEAAKRLQPSCAHQQLAAASAKPGILATRARQGRRGDMCRTTSRRGPPAGQGSRVREVRAATVHPVSADPAQQEHVANLRPHGAARENR